MVRSMIGGCTDYSYQSLEDMEQDLIDQIQYTTEGITTITNNIEIVVESGYWGTVDVDFKGIVSYALKFYDTALKEMIIITKEIQNEVRGDHYKRLRRIGETAIGLNRNFGQVWHREYQNKDYGDEQFAVVERIYADCRDRAVSLQDLQNLAGRIKDFIREKNILPPDPAKMSQKDKDNIFSSLWILESEKADGSNIIQGTAFVAQNTGLLTCAHVLSENIVAFKPNNISKKYSVEVVRQNTAIDLAILRINDTIESNELEVGDSDNIEIFDSVVLAGFPNYNLGDSGVLKSGKIC